jgi:hypothetical protein
MAHYNSKSGVRMLGGLAGSYAGLPLARFGIRGVGGLPFACTPLTCGVEPADGVGAEPGVSSSFLTAEGRLLLLL